MDSSTHRDYSFLVGNRVEFARLQSAVDSPLQRTYLARGAAFVVHNGQLQDTTPGQTIRAR
ncbi:MAG: hypothetical protein FJW30_09240 [Acidobacteria bacterium]|nr:hypothetical protein [Acidobacteriota bacterium]